MSKKTQTPYVRTQPKALQKDQRWTLLFLGNRGKTITFKHFKSVVVTAVVVLVASASIAGWFWYLYRGMLTEIDNHERRIDSLKKAVLSLRNEKDILMARLIVAESRVEESLAKQKPAKKTPVRETVEPIKAQAEPVLKENGRSEISVSANDFIVFHEPNINTLRVQYKIRNLGSREQPVSGRTVILLRDDDDDPKDWLVLPAVPLSAGKPTGQYGRSFSIYNYRTMKFKAANQSGPDRYKTAIVFVYTTTGDLLLEKSFPVGIQPITDSASN